MGQFPSRRADGALLEDEIEGEGAVEGAEVESGRGQSGYHGGAAVAAAHNDGGSGAAMANNFGMGGGVWGAIPFSRARPQLPQRNHADPNPFPALQPNVTLQSLIADGLRPDIALNPYQMPRLGDEWEPSAAAREARGAGEEKEGDAAAVMQDRPTIRCSNPMQLHKSTLMLEPFAPVANRRGSNSGDSGAASAAASQTIAAIPGTAAAAPRPSHSSSFSRRYGLTFQFETRVPCSVQVHWLCNEVPAAPVDDPLSARSSSSSSSRSDSSVAHDIPSRFVPNAGAASVAASSVAGASSEVPAVPLIPAQHFAPGKHTFTLPASAALDTTNLSDLQLAFSNRLRYWPVVVQFDEQITAAGVVASSASGESKEEAERGDSSSVGSSSSSAASSSASSSSPRVRQVTAYCTLSRHALTGAVSLKLVKQAVRIAPTNQRFEIQEIYGLKEEQQVEGGAAAAAAAAAAGGGTIASLSPSSTLGSSSGGPHTSGAGSAAGECVVCLVESKNTLIMPCRHMCLCGDCAVSVKRQTPARCPVCRAPVEGTVRILDA